MSVKEKLEQRFEIFAAMIHTVYESTCGSWQFRKVGLKGTHYCSITGVFREGEAGWHVVVRQCVMLIQQVYLMCWKYN